MVSKLSVTTVNGIPPSPSSLSSDPGQLMYFLEYTYPLKEEDGTPTKSARTPKSFFIEDHLLSYLNLKSIRRSYPKVKRVRVVDPEEREYLTENYNVNVSIIFEITVIESTDVYKHIAPDFPGHFQAYKEFQSEIRYMDQVNSITKITKEEITSIASLSKDCCNFNHSILERVAKRQKRKRKYDELFQTQPVGYFPVAVLPGQYIDHWKTWSKSYLDRMPLNTVLIPPGDE